MIQPRCLYLIGTVFLQFSLLFHFTFPPDSGHLKLRQRKIRCICNMDICRFLHGILQFLQVFFDLFCGLFLACHNCSRNTV